MDRICVIFVMYASVIGLFSYSIFIADCKVFSNQTGLGRVRTCYFNDVPTVHTWF